MVFWGSTYVPSAIRDNDYLRTLNLDLQDLQSFELAQIYRIDDPDFEDTIYTYGLFPGQPETCYPQDLYPDALAYDRNNSRAMQYVYHGVGYLKPEGAVFSGPADHFTGSDHIEILVPYERLLDFYIGPFSPEELSAHLPETNGLDEKLRQAYLEQLASREEDIRYFAGKNGQQELACVAIRDLNGDGVPELLYVTSQEGAGGAFLWIYRYENGQALKCAQLTWEPEAGTEILRCLFQREGDPAFYALYDGWSEEHSINRILRLSLDSAGNLQSSVLSRVETFGGRYPAEFFFEGRACTDEEHWALAEEFYDSASLVLLYDLRDGVDGRSQSGLIDGTLETCPSCSMRYDRAVAWLRGS